MEKTLDGQKLLNYLNWLADNQNFNAIERENSGMDSKVNRECERVARMLIELIERGDYDKK